MYLRPNKRKKNGSDYEYWSLVESVRTARGPRQRIVATIGKQPGLDKEERIGWEEIKRIIDGKPIPQQDLFEEYADPPSWATININKISVERLRHFGDVYMGLLLWNKLGFADFCKEHIQEGKEEIPWSIMASILVLARFCAPSSELKIAQDWYKNAMARCSEPPSTFSSTHHFVTAPHCDNIQVVGSFYIFPYPMIESK